MRVPVHFSYAVLVLTPLFLGVPVFNDARADLVSATLPIEGLAVAVNITTNKIYVANRGSNTVTVINGAANTSLAVGVGPGPSALAVNPVNNKIYVGNEYNNTVTVLDGAANSTSTLVAGFGRKTIAVNPVTNRI